MGCLILLKDKVLGAIFGFCIGDALGVPVEFQSREVLKENPVKDMRAFGTHNQPSGTWSDDSSMTFCLTESLIDGFNIKDIADKYCAWYFNDYWTATGEVFDIGLTTEKAIRKIKNGTKPQNAGEGDFFDNGNGSLMRILPLAFYLEKRKDKIFEITHKVSSITHSHPISLIACSIYITFAIELIRGQNKEDAYSNMTELINNTYANKAYNKELKHFSRILDKNIYNIKKDDIKSTGYVLDTLEASLWSFFNSDSYDKVVLKAVNLGGDTDTIGAVAGGLAGIQYGYKNIRKDWRDKIARQNDIMKLAILFYKTL